jgi:ribonuclease HI
VYKAYVYSLALYGAAAYAPRRTQEAHTALERVHNRAARIITGCTKSTPVRALLKEAHLLPLAVQFEQAAANEYVRACSRPAGDPLRDVAQGALNTGRSWRNVGRSVVEMCGLDVARIDAPLPHASTAPWEVLPQVRFVCDLPWPIARSDPDEARKAASVAALHALPYADCTLWTDGSVKQFGGSGVFITTQHGEERRLSRPAGVHCSSYHAELVAIEAALEAVGREFAVLCDAEAGAEVRIVTDSRSAVQRLGAGPSDQRSQVTDRIWSTLIRLGRDRGATFTFQWILSHCGLTGNDEADALADAGTRMEQTATNFTLDSARAVIARTLRDRWLTASRRSAEERDLHFEFVGPRFPTMPDEAGLCRRMCVEISRLRTNHSLLLLKTMSTYDPIEHPSNTCPDCSQGALDDAEHMLSLCPCPTACGSGCSARTSRLYAGCSTM